MDVSREATKIVYFDLYCLTCKYKDRPEWDPKCHECLNNPVNYESHQPVCWEKGNK